MKIRLPDGRVLLGTPAAIVEVMRDLSWNPDMELEEYMAWAAGRARDQDGRAIMWTGNTLDERCDGFIRAACRAGLAEMVS